MAIIGKLEGWDHSSTEDIARITPEFDEKTKHIIGSDRELAYIKVAGRRTDIPRYCILAGNLQLSGYDFDVLCHHGWLSDSASSSEEATGLFNDSVDAIIDAFEQ